MNWPRSIGCGNGPISDGRMDRGSTARRSLASTAFQASGTARLTSVAARQTRINAVPARATARRCRSVQSSWATAQASSNPLDTRNPPVRKIHGGTCASRLLSSPITRKAVNHHCPGKVRSGCRVTRRRTGNVSTQSTTAPSST